MTEEIPIQLRGLQDPDKPQEQPLELRGVEGERIQGTIYPSTIELEIAHLRRADANRDGRLDRDEIFASYRGLLITTASNHLETVIETTDSSIRTIRPEGTENIEHGVNIYDGSSQIIPNGVVFNGNDVLYSIANRTGVSLDEAARRIREAIPLGVQDLRISDYIQAPFVTEEALQRVPNNPNLIHVGPRLEL